MVNFLKEKELVLVYIHSVLKCGLILLKNVASKKAANKPCESEWDEDYVDVRKINWIK
jgi:hypothetical protein